MRENDGAVRDYLALGYVPEPRTIYKAVHKLPPGHTLAVKRGQALPQPREYWDVRFTLEFQVEGAKGEVQAVDAEAVIRAWSEGLGLVPLMGGVAHIRHHPVAVDAAGLDDNGPGEPPAAATACPYPYSPPRATAAPRRHRPQCSSTRHPRRRPGGRHPRALSRWVRRRWARSRRDPRERHRCEQPRGDVRLPAPVVVDFDSTLVSTLVAVTIAPTSTPRRSTVSSA